MRKILLLVEGQTEETFVKQIINPYLAVFDKYAIPTIITTKIAKRGNHFKGDVPAYQNVKRQIRRLLNDSSAVIVGTFIDYYGLPDSFPGKESLPDTIPIEKVRYLEDELRNDISEPRFLPYYSLHEFEALLFSDPTTIAVSLTSPDKAQILKNFRQQFPSPEEINDNPQTCPSARIESVFKNYQKVLYGSLISRRIGLEKIRRECRHFSEWLERIENA